MMEGGKRNGKEIEPVGSSRVSSSSCSSSSINPGASTVVNLSKCNPIHVDKGIPTPASENSFSTNEWSMVSVTPRFDNVSTLFSQSSGSVHSNQPIKLASPLIQPMDQSPGYDPSRLPSSIFSNKPAMPYDWSIASNESLFSITNYSFSKDQGFLDIMSGQCGPIGETSNPPTNCPSHVSESKANEAKNVSANNLCLVNKNATQHERKQSSDINVNDEGASKQFEGMAQNISANDHSKVQSCTGAERSSTCSSATQPSSKSGKSSSSFAFPVLVNGFKKTSSLAKPLFKKSKTITKKSKTRWCSFSRLRTWPRCHSCCSKTGRYHKT